jgi:hypothetical protein
MALWNFFLKLDLLLSLSVESGQALIFLEDFEDLDLEDAVDPSSLSVLLLRAIGLDVALLLALVTDFIFHPFLIRLLAIYMSTLLLSERCSSGHGAHNRMLLCGTD